MAIGEEHIGQILSSLDAIASQLEEIKILLEKQSS